MTKEQNLYEGMYIISATLSEGARAKALEKIKNSIKEQGGEILKVHDWGRRKLAYEINKQREGYYYIIYFKVAPSAIEAMWREYHLNEDLLRFMTQTAKEVLEKIEFKSLVEQS